MISRLSFKLTAGIIIVLTMVTVVFVPVYIQFQKEAYISSELDTMQEFYKNFKDISFLSDKYEIDNYIEKNDTRNYAIIICDSYFNKVYVSSGMRNKSGIHYERIAKNVDLFSNDATPEYIVNSDKAIEEILLRKIEKQNNENYYVYIRESVRAADSVLAYTNQNIILILAGYTIMCALLLIFLLNNSIKAIKQLSYVTEKISQKDYSVRYDGKITNDEIGALSQNINEMADTIQESINSMKNYNFLLKEDLNYMTEYDRIRKNVLSNVTHELKTPLAIISSQVEMMNCVTDEAKREFYYSSAISEIDKMSRLISRLLNYSATEYDIFEGEIKKVNLSKVVRQLCENSRNYVLSNNISFKTDIEEDCILNMEQNHIEHVFNNFISNAIHHSNPGGKISVKLKKDGEKVRLSVYNKGNLIEDKYKDKIWTNFFASGNDFDATRSAHVGLGLFIVKEISVIDHTSCGFINHSRGVEFWFDFISK